jgi:CheY-like chemotaxis protein
MIVDDDVAIQELCTLVLEDNGYEVKTALNGEEALNLYRELMNDKRKPDIVIMDYRMPVMNGIEATKAILLLDTNARIIFASADATIFEEAAALGVMKMKLKPVDMKRLISNIKTQLMLAEETKTNQV